MNILSCKQVAERISKSADDSISRREKVAVALHLMMCSYCRRFQRQVRFLGSAFKQWGRMAEAGGPLPEWRLPEASRQRIKQALLAVGDEPGDELSE